jgi:hypothetical protein
MRASFHHLCSHHQNGCETDCSDNDDVFSALQCVLFYFLDHYLGTKCKAVLQTVILWWECCVYLKM